MGHIWIRRKTVIGICCMIVSFVYFLFECILSSSSLPYSLSLSLSLICHFKFNTKMPEKSPCSVYHQHITQLTTPPDHQTTRPPDHQTARPRDHHRSQTTDHR